MENPSASSVFAKLVKAGNDFVPSLTILAILVSLIPMSAMGQSSGPEFISLVPAIADKDNFTSRSFGQGTTPEGYLLGYVQNPVNLSLVNRNTVRRSRLLAYTPSFDLRTSGKVSPVKNQNPFGDCWAFATYGSLESCLLPGELTDYSESNMVNLAGFEGLSPDSGGNIFISAAYLTRWDGPINESDDPYPKILAGSRGTYTVQKHVQNIYILPTRIGPMDNGWIKHALTSYGAVYTSMCWNASNNDTHNNCTYYDPVAYETPNHAITIVGWDDNFPADKFPHGGAPENGAFLVKNSWGAAWGNGGYFWISYYDTVLGCYDVNVVTAEPVNNYQNIYGYDELGINNYGGWYGAGSGYFAGVFTASADEQIKAVSFYTVYPGEPYTIKIYASPASGDPASGTLLDTESGTLADPGYRTVKLASPVYVTGGQTFSIVVQLSYPGEVDRFTPYFYVPYESSDDYFYRNIAVSPAGRGFFSLSGADWTDVTTLDDERRANIDLKVFTNDNVPILQFRQGTYSVDENNGTVALVVDRVGPTGSTVTVNYRTTDGTASAGTNYRAPEPNPQTLSIPSSASSGVITIPILDDGLYSNSSRTFTVTLSSPTNALLNQSSTQAAVAIRDQDPAPVLQFNASKYTTISDGGSLLINVTRANDAWNDVTVNYSTSDGTAHQPADYEARSGTLLFGKGQMSRTFTVPISSVDLGNESRSFNVTLSGPEGGATIGALNRTIVTIVNSTSSFTYNLTAGWNMISVPFELFNSSVESFFPADVRGKVSDMWWYDHGSWSYYSGIDGYINKYTNLTNVEPGKGYYVLLTDNVSFTVHGQLNGSGVPAAGPGWTLFGVRGFDSINATTVYPNNLDLWYLDNGTWYYYSGKDGYLAKYPHLVSLDPGKGYWVNYG